MDIVIYKTESGQSPYLKWFNKQLSDYQRIIVNRRLDRIGRFGHLGDYKFITKNIIELRIFSESGIRIYLGKSTKLQVVLLLGGNKSSQRQDINRAKIIWSDFVRRLDGKL